jgi:hypothetical protein
LCSNKIKWFYADANKIEPISKVQTILFIFIYLVITTFLTGFSTYMCTKLSEYIKVRLANGTYTCLRVH